MRRGGSEKGGAVDKHAKEVSGGGFGGDGAGSQGGLTSG